MEHWLAVGSDIWWVVRWPMFCFLWVSVGIALKSKNSDNFGAALFATAVLVTLIVANT